MIDVEEGAELLKRATALGFEQRLGAALRRNFAAGRFTTRQPSASISTARRERSRRSRYSLPPCSWALAGIVIIGSQEKKLELARTNRMALPMAGNANRSPSLLVRSRLPFLAG